MSLQSRAEELVVSGKIVAPKLSSTAPKYRFAAYLPLREVQLEAGRVYRCIVTGKNEEDKELKLLIIYLVGDSIDRR